MLKTTWENWFIPPCKTSASTQGKGSKLRKPLSVGSLLMEKIFRSAPNGVLTAHTEWLLGVWLRHSVPPVQYIQRIVRVGGCLVVVAQWPSTGGSSQVVQGLIPSDCWPFHLLLFSPQNIILLIPTWGKLSSKHRYYNLILIPRPSHCPDCELWSEVDSGKVETRALIGANKDLVWGPVQGVQGVCPGGSETVVFLSTIQQGPKVMHKHCNKACSNEQYKVRGTVLHYRVNLVPRPRPAVRWLYYRKAGES